MSEREGGIWGEEAMGEFIGDFIGEERGEFSGEGTGEFSGEETGEFSGEEAGEFFGNNSRDLFLEEKDSKETRFLFAPIFGDEGAPVDKLRIEFCKETLSGEEWEALFNENVLSIAFDGMGEWFTGERLGALLFSVIFMKSSKFSSDFLNNERCGVLFSFFIGDE